MKACAWLHAEPAENADTIENPKRKAKAVSTPRHALIITVAAALCLVTGSCTPGANGHTPSPSAKAPTTESSIEKRTRLDYEAAEKAYRASLAEQVRLHQAGGTDEASPALKETATGKYLEFILGSLQSTKAAKAHAVGSAEVVGVSHDGGWQKGKVKITACEDNTGIKIMDRSGKDITPKDPRHYVQTLTVTKVGEQWKVAELSSRPVKTFDNEGCSS